MQAAGDVDEVNRCSLSVHGLNADASDNCVGSLARLQAGNQSKTDYTDGQTDGRTDRASDRRSDYSAYGAALFTLVGRTTDGRTR